MSRTTQERTLSAVALMTTWLATGDEPQRFQNCLQAQIEEHPSHARASAAVELVMGMTHLSGGLLILLQRATGSSAAEILQVLGQFYAEGYDGDVPPPPPS